MLRRVDDHAIERYIPALRRFAWALTRNQDDADDLVQESLVKALSAWRQLRATGSVRAWLFQILYNVHRSNVRRRPWLTVDLPPDDDKEHPATMSNPEHRVQIEKC